MPLTRYHGVFAAASAALTRHRPAGVMYTGQETSRQP
jgi:hypothetical protein